MTNEERELRDKADVQALLKHVEFQRFLWRVIQRARIFGATADGSNERDLSFYEGARHLGLEILEMVDEGQPRQHPDKVPVLTLIQVLREEANQPGGGRPNERTRYSRTDELDD